MDKIAHTPLTNDIMHEKLITRQSYADGMAKMFYLIDREENHSKFYEMVVIPAGMGRFKLLKVWGRLTDAIGGGHISRKVEDHATLDSALNSMYKKSREELRKGYKDAFKTTNGMYPIGLGEGPFNHGGQEALAIVDDLRKLLGQVNVAIEAGLDDDRDGMAKALAEMGRVLFDLPNSTMARELEKKLAAPASAMLGVGNYSQSPRALVRGLNGVRRFIQGQLSEVGV
jgi:predicted DNA-binding WGR domain protein